MKTLIYEKFEFTFPEISFFYVFNGEQIVYKVRISCLSKESLLGKNKETLDNIIFHLGMALISFVFCLEDFDEIVVKPYKITPDFANFFAKYFKFGLAELRFINGLDIKKEIVIRSLSSREMPGVSEEPLLEEAIVLNGEGKDSAVAGEITRNIGLPFAWLAIEPSEKIKDNMKASQNNNFIVANIIYDPKIKEMMKYKDRKPFSAVAGFLGLLVSYLLNLKYIISGNEYSSNFGNVVHEGMEINHQYCKSIYFETDLFEYIRKEILTNSYYFSILRPLYEIQICKIFSSFKQYHEHFTSCNNGRRKNYWCNKCEKCAFIFLSLYAFLEEKEMKKIFGQDLFLSPDIQKHLGDLCLKRTRPFECVGLQEECILALMISVQKNPKLLEIPEIKEIFIQIGNVDLEDYKKTYLLYWDRKNNFPDHLKKKIFAFLEKKLAI